MTLRTRTSCYNSDDKMVTNIAGTKTSKHLGPAISPHAMVRSPADERWRDTTPITRISRRASAFGRQSRRKVYRASRSA